MIGIGNFVPLVCNIQRAGIDQRVVLHPSIFLEEIRTVAGEKIAGHGNPKLTVHNKLLPSERYAHRSLHLCPHVTVPRTLLTRDQPARQETSVTLQDQQRDWDFLERHRDLVFDTQGIRMADSTWDKVHALAEDIWTFRREIQKPGGNDFSRSCPWSHPVDTLVYGSWCLGGAYALVALCATIGVPARELSIWGHSIAEAWVGGQWCTIESISRFPKAGGTNMLPVGFAELRLEPFDPSRPLADEQRETYWETDMLMIRGAENGLWLQQIRGTCYQPQTAMALYPGWSEPRFKSHWPDRYRLLDGQVTLAGEPALILRPGRAFQRRFWVGSLAETRGIRAALCGPEHAMPNRNLPADGGDWFLSVNGKVHPVRDVGGWPFVPSGECGPWRMEFDLPLEELYEHAWNTLAIGCPGRPSAQHSAPTAAGEYLWFGGEGEWSAPEEPCLCPEI